jgi:hypothetical protein
MAAPQRIIPHGMTFERAARAGYLGRFECEKYLAWLRTKPCDSCGAPPPTGGSTDPSHLNNWFPGGGTKSPDHLAIPECRRCHEIYEAAVNSRVLVQPRLARAAIYLMWAIYEGVFQ